MQLVDVHLGGPTEYPDAPAVPERFARGFKMWVWDDGEAEGELRIGGPAPKGADDVVSQTILSHGVWEPAQTIFMLSAFEANKDATFLDFGAHLGWYSLLALSSGLKAVAIDGNERGLTTLKASYLANAFQHDLGLVRVIITESATVLLPTGDEQFIVKIDVEGAERLVVNGLMDCFKRHQISHCLMEVSPVFDDYYPDLLERLFDLGYEGYCMPAKRHPPPVFGDTETFLHRHCFGLHRLEPSSMKDWVADQHQFDVILVSPNSGKWG